MNFTESITSGGYAILVAALIYGLDYSVFGRMMNIINISRLASEKGEDSRSYKPFTMRRGICIFFAATCFAAGRELPSPFQQILYVACAVTAAITVLTTLAESTSDASN